MASRNTASCPPTWVSQRVLQDGNPKTDGKVGTWKYEVNIIHTIMETMFASLLSGHKSIYSNSPKISKNKRIMTIVVGFYPDILPCYLSGGYYKYRCPTFTQPGNPANAHLVDGHHSAERHPRNVGDGSFHNGNPHLARLLREDHPTIQWAKIAWLGSPQFLDCPHGWFFKGKSRFFKRFFLFGGTHRCNDWSVFREREKCAYDSTESLWHD